ncbi:MAG: ABC transporter ATP-binding protein/permease, partial [Psychrosphaera sp.]|nr:ABC transporter ATP-binding protein/permease [Psychrosphaera sp.]
MNKTTKHNIRQRSVLPGRERWEVDILLNNTILAEKINLALSGNNAIYNVIANPLSGRVLVIFQPCLFAAGAIGKLIADALHHESEEQALDQQAQETAAYSRQASFKQKLQSNELYQLIKITEVNSKLRYQATRLSVTHSVFKMMSPIFIGLMVSSVLFPIAALTKMGLSKGVQLVIFSSLFAASRVAESTTQHRKTCAWSRYSNEVGNSLRQATFKHVQSLPMSYLEDQNTEKLMSIVNSDAETIQRFLNYTPAELTDKITTIAIGSGVILAISPIAFVLSLLPVPFITKLGKRQQQATLEKYQNAAVYDDDYRHILSNNLNGLSTVKSFTAEELEIERNNKAATAVTKNAIALDKENSYFGSTTEFAYVVGIMGPLIYGCVNVFKGTIGMTQFMIQNGIAPSLLVATTGLEYSKSLYRDAEAAATRINKLLSTVPEVSKPSNEVPFEVVRAELKFDNISFGYTDQLVLNDISF